MKRRLIAIVVGLILMANAMAMLTLVSLVTLDSGLSRVEAAGLRYSLNTPVVDGNVTPVVGGYQRITDLSSAVTPAQQTGADVMVIQAEAQTLRYTVDGTTPTATIGFPLPAGTRLTYPGDLSTIQLIETVSGGIAHVQPYRY